MPNKKRILGKFNGTSTALWPWSLPTTREDICKILINPQYRDDAVLTTLRIFFRI